MKDQIVAQTSSDASLLLNIDPKKFHITFYKQGEPVGYIDWSESPIKFHGSIDESVRIFFEALQLMTEIKGKRR